MGQATTFDEVLDAVEQLPADQQADLVEILRRRLAARERERVIADVREAREQFAQGKLKPSSIEEICGEIEP
jgi:hypothetical protein